MFWSLSNELVRNGIASAVWVVFVLLARLLLVRLLKVAEVSQPELRRRWLVQIRTATVLTLAAGLAVVWATELRTIALSLVALAVAVVIATKELLLCLAGSLFKMGARAFSVGDRIEIKGMHGEVVDQTLLATTIMEVGPGRLQQRSGRFIVLPNSLFLSEPLINETLGGRYALHVFTVPLRATDDWRTAEKVLLEVATEQCAPFLEDARRELAFLAASRYLETLAVEPRVAVQLPTPEELHLVVRLPVPVEQRSRVEQAVLREFLNRWSSRGPGQG